MNICNTKKSSILYRRTLETAVLHRFKIRSYRIAKNKRKAHLDCENLALVLFTVVFPDDAAH